MATNITQNILEKSVNLSSQHKYTPLMKWANSELELIETKLFNLMEVKDLNLGLRIQTQNLLEYFEEVKGLVKSTFYSMGTNMNNDFTWQLKNIPLYILNLKETVKTLSDSILEYLYPIQYDYKNNIYI